MDNLYKQLIIFKIDTIQRTYVPDNKVITTKKNQMFKIKRFLMFNCFSKVNWSVNWVDYNPRDYTASKLIKEKPVWADIVNSRDISFWNELDPNTKVDRRSHMGNYKVIDGLPQNPVNILIERERKRVKKRNILVYFKFST